MGYATRFELQVIQGDKAIHEILKKETKETFSELFCAVNENGEVNERCKWYEHEEDMVSLSLKNPGVLFCLSGEGESARDIWKSILKMEKCKKLRLRLLLNRMMKVNLKK